MSREHLIQAIRRETDHLNELGARPAGSPAALRDYARALQIEHETLAHAAKSQHKVPAGLDFKGPAADRFRTNAEETSVEIGRLAGAVASVAERVGHAANQLEHHQGTWDWAFRQYSAKIESLNHQLRTAR